MSLTDRVCEHGSPLGQHQLPAGGWSGGISECKCCLSKFGYIDSFGMFTDSTTGETKTSGTRTDKKRCRTCGGEVTKF